MSIQLIHNSVLHIHRYWFDWEIGRGKKRKKNSATSCYIVSRHASQISKLQWLWLYIIDETDL